MGPYGPQPGPGPNPDWAPTRDLEESVGPARALEEREKIMKNALLFYAFLRKNAVFGLQTTFFDGFNVLLSFLAEKRYRTILKSLQKVSLGPETY